MRETNAKQSAEPAAPQRRQDIIWISMGVVIAAFGGLWYYRSWQNRESTDASDTTTQLECSQTQIAQLTQSPNVETETTAQTVSKSDTSHSVEKPTNVYNPYLDSSLMDEQQKYSPKQNAKFVASYSKPISL